MSNLWLRDNETNNLTEYTGSSTGSGDLSISVNAALHGTYGLQCLINDTADKWAYMSVTKTVKHRSRFYFNTNSVTMADGDRVPINWMVQWGGGWGTVHMIFLTRVSGAYKFELSVYTDASIDPTYIDTCSVANGLHCIEYYIQQATNSTSADGSVQWLVNDTDQGTYSALDNYNTLFDASWRAYLGVLWLSWSAPGTSGTIYWDDWAANNDGSAIGMISTGWQNIKKVNSVDSASISKIMGVPVASI